MPRFSTNNRLETIEQLKQTTFDIVIVGGGITGKGAHVLVIDDPVKNREDAESEYSRDSVWDWYTSTAYTRLAPGGGILVILTRWHDDDLAGRLLAAAADGADDWEVVKYPAIAEQDEEFRNAFKGLGLGDSTLSIKCELIDDHRDTSFTPSEVNRNPLETMRRLLQFCQEVNTKSRRI